jgi:predicted glutamine amidotransferase
VCLLCFSPAGTMPKREDIETACDNNPDGFGFAIRINDTILTSRGLDKDRIINKFLAIKEAYPNSDGMFHARLATHGTINTENCHPFRVQGDKRLVLAHNGILPMEVPIKSNRSDTRIFADDILPAMGIEILDNYSNRLALEDWLGSNKIVIMSTHPALKKDYYILNEDQGVDNDGVWYSNCSYQPYTTRYSTYSSKYVLNSPTNINTTNWDTWYNDAYCAACNSTLTDKDYYEGYCLICEACIECMATMENCLCYSPEYTKGYDYEPNSANW